MNPPVVLTIAGFDPSSGAGITADVKTIAAHQCYGVACITALTVQSTAGVRRVEAVKPSLIRETLDELLSDIEPAAVHIGMLGNHGAVQAVAEFLERARLAHVVLDPILQSTSGTDLLDEQGKKLLIERLLPLSEVVTPNLNEAGALTGLPVADLEQMRQAAAGLHSLGSANVVVTGGDLEKATDLLSFTTPRGIEQEVFTAGRQKSNSTHGTGCAFATAVACHLAHGRGLPEAVLLSKAYVASAISHAHPVGRGFGPLHHLYRMNRERRPGPVYREPEAADARKGQRSDQIV
jgi:hydroxymethylpyrimidine/phosphomethylpyrimidine kinase